MAAPPVAAPSEPSSVKQSFTIGGHLDDHCVGRNQMSILYNIIITVITLKGLDRLADVGVIAAPQKYY